MIFLHYITILSWRNTLEWIEIHYCAKNFEKCTDHLCKWDKATEGCKSIQCNDEDDDDYSFILYNSSDETPEYTEICPDYVSSGKDLHNFKE